MENTDNILNEMQQQLRQMKEKLEGETIVNDKLLRNAYRKTLGSLQRKALRQTIIGIVAMLLSLNLRTVGFSIPFVIATEVMLAFCLAATIIINNRLPKMDTDLVTAAKGIVRFRKGYANWLWIGIPLLILWLGGMVYEIMKKGGSTEPPDLFIWIRSVRRPLCRWDRGLCRNCSGSRDRKGFHRTFPYRYICHMLPYVLR